MYILINYLRDAAIKSAAKVTHNSSCSVVGPAQLLSFSPLLFYEYHDVFVVHDLNLQ